MSKSVRLGAGQCNSTYSSGGRSNSFGVQYGNKLAGLPPNATGSSYFMRLYKIKSYPRKNSLITVIGYLTSDFIRYNNVINNTDLKQNLIDFMTRIKRVNNMILPELKTIFLDQPQLIINVIDNLPLDQNAVNKAINNFANELNYLLNDLSTVLDVNLIKELNKLIAIMLAASV
jgi:hypothetical protein